MDMVAEQPVKKRKQRQRVKYLDIQVPEAKDERRAALQKLYERERTKKRKEAKKKASPPKTCDAQVQCNLDYKERVCQTRSEQLERENFRLREQIKMQGKWLDEKDAKLNLAGKELVKQRNELRAIKQSL